MRKNIMRAAVAHALMATCALTALGTGSVYADTNDELKAEINAQRLRLEALEKKLDASMRATQDAQAQVQKVQAESARETSGGASSGFSYKVGGSEVTLYGLIEVAASSVDHANAKNQRLTSFQTPWFSGSRWGISAKHSLNKDGLKVIAKLESEYEPATGNQDTPGVLFNRDAWVGFESPSFGKLTFGRQNALARDYSGIFGDPYGNARVTLEEGGYTNTNNFKQLIFYAASATGTRYDRGIVWKKQFGNFVAGLGYQFGGVAGDFNTGSTKTVAFGYNGDGDVFHLAGFVNHFNLAGLTHKAYSFGGNVAMGPIVRLNAGYYAYNSEQGGNVGNRKDKAYTVSTKITPPGPVDFELGYQIIEGKNAGLNAAGFVLNPNANALAVTKTANGDRKTFYISTFYNFDKQAAVYFAADRLNLTDGYKVAATNGKKDQTEVAVGMRYKF
jgi:predicted porin